MIKENEANDSKALAHELRRCIDNKLLFIYETTPYNPTKILEALYRENQIDLKGQTYDSLEIDSKDIDDCLNDWLYRGIEPAANAIKTHKHQYLIENAKRDPREKEKLI